jgi:hypothetical protein
MDENKWVDNVLCLHKSAKEILLGLEGFKHTLQYSRNVKENQEKDFDNTLTQELFRILVDQEFASQRKSIVKSFPKFNRVSFFISSHRIFCRILIMQMI